MRKRKNQALKVRKILLKKSKKNINLVLQKQAKINFKTKTKAPMKIKNAIKRFFILSLSMLMLNCNNENDEQTKRESAINKAKEWLEENKPNLPVLKYTKKIDWNNAIISSGSKGDAIEVPISLQENILVSSYGSSFKTYNRLLFMVDQEKTYKLSHIVISTSTSDFDVNDKNFNFYHVAKDFEGTVITLNSDSRINYFNSGKSSSIKSSTSKMQLEDQICYGLYEIYDDGSSRFIGLLYCTGGSGSPTGGGSGGNGEYGGDGDGQNTRSAAQIIIESIDTSKLDACTKEVFDALNANSYASLSNVLTRLGANKEYNVEMKMGQTSLNNYAETQRRAKNDYTITINPDYQDATMLYKASAIVHELMHAYFLSIVDDYANYPTNAPFAEYPILFEAYVTKTLPYNASIAQHEAMATTAVDNMADALYEYQSNHPPFIMDSSKELYLDLIWFGFRDSPTFKNKYPEGSAAYNRIMNRARAEQTGHAIGEGTPYAQTPRGKKCQ